MRKISKLFSLVFLFLCMGCFTLQANARLSYGPVYYEDTGSCGISLTYTVENGVLRIQGTGDMYDYFDVGNPPWNPFAFQQIVIESGVTSVGSGAFNYANGSPITNVQLPDTLKRIGDSAFSGCNNLAELVLPEGLTAIEDGAFSGCTALKELSIPRSVTRIGGCIWSPAVREDDPALRENQPSDWAKAEVDEAALRELLTRRTCTGYQEEITRIQIAELAANLVEKAIYGRAVAPLPDGSLIDWEFFCASEIPPAEENRFQDTSDYMVRKAYAAGIVTGRSEGVFDPSAKATREEIAAILCRAADYVKEHTEGYSGLNMAASLPDQYADSTQVSSWASPYVAALTDAGILTGTSDTTLSPQNYTSVQEAIVLTLRLYKHILG